MIDLETFWEASCGGGHEGGRRGLLSYDLGFVEMKSRIWCHSFSTTTCYDDHYDERRRQTTTTTTTTIDKGGDNDDDDDDDDDDNDDDDDDVNGDLHCDGGANQK